MTTTWMGGEIGRSDNNKPKLWMGLDILERGKVWKLTCVNIHMVKKDTYIFHGSFPSFEHKAIILWASRNFELCL